MFSSRRHALALAADLLRQNHLYITTDQFFRLNKNESDEMPRKLNSIENPRALEKFPTTPYPKLPFDTSASPPTSLTRSLIQHRLALQEKKTPPSFSNNAYSL